MTTKNWTEAQVATLEASYNGREDNEKLGAIADQLGKSVHAVRSKLVSMKVYEANGAKSVGGASAVRKAHLVRQVNEALKGQGLASLEKATKSDLEALLVLIETSQTEAYNEGFGDAEVGEID